jgi:hypothetical protein
MIHTFMYTKIYAAKGKNGCKKRWETLIGNSQRESERDTQKIVVALFILWAGWFMFARNFQSVHCTVHPLPNIPLTLQLYQLAHKTSHTLINRGRGHKEMSPILADQ